MMKKIINQPDQLFDEMLQGLSLAYSDKIERLPDLDVIIRKNLPKQVGLISGGGSGHEPAHAGFVGDGMLTAAVCGQVFTSPTANQVYEAIKAGNTGEGVLLIIKNYSGDVMNFEFAIEMAEMDGIKVDKVIVDDDISIEEAGQGRRGVAGTILVHKILGAAARKGATLEELVALGEEVVSRTKTIGVALSGATVPEVGHPGFTLEDDELEFGVGIHGEQGYSREAMQSSLDIAKEIVGKMKPAFNWNKEDEYGVLVNGMGSTPLMEQFVFYNDVHRLLTDEGLTLTFSKVGEYMTAIDMQGLSLTMIALTPEMIDYLKEDVDVIGW